MISIIIPARNEEAYLEVSLETLYKMTVPHELIVSNDRSTDRTREIALRYTDRVIDCVNTSGTISAVRNAGAKSATGDILVFMDADSRITDPDQFFSVALQAFANNKDLVAETAWIKVYPETETLTDKVMWFLFNSYMLILNRLGIGSASGKIHIIRRTAFEKVGGYREDLVASEDFELFNRLARIGKVRTDRKLTIYHSARHIHAWGWPKTLWIWTINNLNFRFRGKAYSKQWPVIR